MLLSEFDYDLPPERIAQRPLAQRDAARLLWLDRASGALADHQFGDLPGLLAPGDLMVANAARVTPVRLLGHIAPNPDARADHAQAEGAQAEALLTRRESADTWTALVRPARKLPPGARLVFAPAFAADIVAAGDRGERRLRFNCSGPALDKLVEQLGHVPLPPYIRRPDDAADRERYQTVYAQTPGAAAAPTAGLHFTPAVLDRLRQRGVEWTTVHLEVGLGTFQPVVAEHIEDHLMHAERYTVGPDAAQAISRARAERRRIVAVGTTAARVLETVAAERGPEDDYAAWMAGEGASRLFLYPGRRFRLVGAMVTNFHAPRSTLLMMIAAFASLPLLRQAYDHALAHGYRFLSYGDAMLIT